MQITHTEKDGIYIIRPEGDIIIDQVESFKQYVEPFLDEESIQTLLFDFQKVGFLDSVGIGALVSLSRKCRSKNIGFVLCNMESVVRSIFDMTHLDKVIAIFTTEEQALESIRSRLHP